jgi:hypothetical protein
MTPKEKALELFDKMYEYQEGYQTDPDNLAKKCALICVDEILLHEKTAHSVLDKSTDYWQEVKEEINKL